MSTIDRDTLFGLTDDDVFRALGIPNWLEDRVLPHLEGHPNPNTCWTWTRYTRDGYGQVALPSAVRRTHVGVHRVVWLATNGPIKRGFVLDHDGSNGCCNRACSNPAHLEAVTLRHNSVVTGNSITAVQSRKTHCPRGHELERNNLVPASLRVGKRQCLTCARADSHAANEIRNAAARALGVSQSEMRRRVGASLSAAKSILEGSQP